LDDVLVAIITFGCSKRVYISSTNAEITWQIANTNTAYHSHCGTWATSKRVPVATALTEMDTNHAYILTQTKHLIM